MASTASCIHSHLVSIRSCRTKRCQNWSSKIYRSADCLWYLNDYNINAAQRKKHGNAKGLTSQLAWNCWFTVNHFKQDRYWMNLRYFRVIVTDCQPRAFTFVFKIVLQVTIKVILTPNLSPFGQWSTGKNSHPKANLAQLMAFSQRKWTIKNIWKWNKLLTFQINVWSSSGK